MAVGTCSTKARESKSHLPEPVVASRRSQLLHKRIAFWVGGTFQPILMRMRPDHLMLIQKHDSHSNWNAVSIGHRPLSQ